jgi:hypothetical protein
MPSALLCGVVLMFMIYTGLFALGRAKFSLATRKHSVTKQAFLFHMVSSCKRVANLFFLYL